MHSESEMTKIKSMNNNIKIYMQGYKKWISSKPQVTSDIESAIRCLSFMIAGRFSSSSFVSELIYSLPNLFILVNDCLIYNTKYMHLKLTQYKSKIKIWLTVIEYIEALVEVSAQNLWSNTGKWIIICIVQAFKAILRLLLIHRDRERITCNPPIPELNREILNAEFQNENLPKEGFVLKHSGIIVRSVNATGPYKSRTWAPLTPTLYDDSLVEFENSIIRRNLLFAETLYIMKPMIHLTSLMIKGKKNWIPWATALTMDLISLHVISRECSRGGFTKQERNEIYRRKVHLLLYLLRSPFYDNCSKAKIHSLLNIFSKNVPFGKFIGEPLAKYLPHWQKKYFYMWSS